MAKATNSNVIMISIHPQYAKAILSGGKKIEFRKLNIPKTVDHVVLYATAPEQKIMGYFSIKEIIEDKPSELWRKFNKISGTTIDFFEKYYNNQKLGLGLLINQVHILANPFTLDKAGVATKPPQSFLYIDSRLWKNLKRRKKKLL